jgi:hypothetical protein
LGKRRRDFGLDIAEAVVFNNAELQAAHALAQVPAEVFCRGQTASL